MPTPQASAASHSDSQILRFSDSPAWVVHYTTTPSTMDTAAHLATLGAPHLSLVTTSAQPQGRGRQGKAWAMLPGAFAGTYIVRTGLGPHLPLITSLALLKTCRTLLTQASEASPSPTPQLFNSSTLKSPEANHSSTPQLFNSSTVGALAIKWPNDLLKHGEKIAGILVEQRSDNFALIGIGLNLVVAPPEPYQALFGAPHGPQVPAQSPLVPLQGPQVPAVLTPCLQEHLHLYSSHGWSAFRAQYQQECATIGQFIRWKPTPTTEISGKVKGLDPNGALELEDENGVIHLIRAGEIISQAVES